VFSLSAPVSDLGLSLWYGRWPERKQLILASADDDVLEAGPHVRYFWPRDAQCPVYDTDVVNSGALEEHDFPEDCIIGSAPERASMCPNGRWSTAHEDCGFDYADALLYLTAESCGAEVEELATLVSVRHFDTPVACVCSGEQDCEDQTTCRLEAGVELPNCPSCTGICSPASSACPFENADCTVAVDGQTCPSTIVCVGDEAVCPVPSNCP
jgi:hypothetical protein